MANRVREVFESIVYAGMKPQARTPGEPAAKTGLFARLMNGSAGSDPLYLTNQSLGQRARRILVMVAPVIILFALGAVAASYFHSKPEQVKPFTNAELEEKTLPGFNKQFKLDTNKEIEVTEIHFERGVMAGKLRNTTAHAIVQATVVFELADAGDSRLGGVTVTEINLAAGEARAFRQPIEQTNAVSALVRDVDTR